MNANRSPAPIFSALNTNRVVQTKPWLTPNRIFYGIIIALVITIITLISVYWNTIYNYFDKLVNPEPEPEPTPVPAPAPVPQPVINVINAPPPPSPPPQASLVEKVLPGRREVFNISQNRYTFYDAEPLCKSLGAEIATYDQLKKAYEDGGDWCNYGWTAGQMALYPTQSDTWQKLQAGPEGQRMSCGKVGLNGGYFDNPELRFGVNCYGVKPVQKNHDASLVSNNENYPESPETIEFDKKVAKFSSLVDTIGILPFKKGTWND
jgi:hypothetical protein